MNIGTILPGFVRRLASGLVIPSGQDIKVFNTADEVSNTEYLQVVWISNEAYILVAKAGSGTARNLYINGQPGNFIGLLTNGEVDISAAGSNKSVVISPTGNGYVYTYGIGLLATNSILLTNATEGGTASLNRVAARGLSAAMSGASVTITLNIPTNARLLAVSFNVNTLITSAVGVSWTATFSGGSAVVICTGQAFTKDTKTDIWLATAGLSTPPITTGVTDIAITPNAGTFTAGVIECVAYYETLTSMASA